MARTRIQCDCGAKMKPAEQVAPAPALKVHLDKLAQILPQASIKTHVCSKCSRAHVHVKV